MMMFIFTSASKLSNEPRKTDNCSLKLAPICYKILGSIPVVLVLLISLLLSPSRVFSDYGASGWPIFNKLQSSQFEAISKVSPDNPDISGVVYNPSMLAAVNEKEITFVSELGFADSKFGALIIGLPVKSGMVSVGVAYFDAGITELNWLDSSGELQTRDAYAERDYLGVASYEHPISGKLFAGVSVKGASSELAEYKTAIAVAGDIGLYYLPRPNLSFTAALQNVGNSTAFIATPDKLPEGVYAGASYIHPFAGLQLTTALGATYLLPDAEMNPEAGIELGGKIVSVNAGYRFWNNESNVHLGLRIMYGNTIFGYAYLPGLHLDAVQRLSISFHFGHK